MTIQASLLDLDTLLVAARAVAARLDALGELDARVLGSHERSGQSLAGGVALAVRTTGEQGGLVGLVAGPTASEALAAGSDADPAELWRPVMSDVLAALTDVTGDLHPEAVQVLPASAGHGPALDPRAVAFGVFRAGELVAAVGFTADDGSGQQATAFPGAAGAAGSVAHMAAGAGAGAGLGAGSGIGTGSAAGAAFAFGGEPTGSASVFQPLAGGAGAAVDSRRLHLLRDVEMGVSVELGRTRMTVRELLALAPGAIVELDKPAGAPVDLLVNGTLMARGEVVVIDEEFAVRITEIVSGDQDGRPGS